MIIEHVPPEQPFIWFNQVVDDFGNLIELFPVFQSIELMLRSPWGQAVHHITAETL